MSVLTLAQSLTAIGPGLTSSFLASGGVSPYTYSLRAGGANGGIDPGTGLYTAPPEVDSDPLTAYDYVIATDTVGATATAKILVGLPLILFCEIIQKEMSLADGRVYLWDQKIFQPSDNDLYIAVSVSSCKPFGNTLSPNAGSTSWALPLQSVNMLATLDLDIISRGPAARDRKEEVVMAFNSIYAQAQQEANSFYIGKLPPGARFVNLSMIDGAAIPYRFKISVNMQYMVTKQKAVPFFDTFQDVPVATNP